MEVQIISTETIKPSSSSTFSHPKIFKHSLLDQLIPSRYAPLILFYPMDKNTNFDLCKRLDLLKSSLSETIACFYPLSGTIRDEFSIDCSDKGACFVETRVNCTLEKFLTKPDLLSLNSFLPCEFVSDETMVGTFATNVQANVFECDGIAFGICISHRLMDGDGLRMFLKMWTSSSTNKLEQTGFVAAGMGTRASDIFHADDLWLRDSSNVMSGSFLKKGTCSNKSKQLNFAAVGMGTGAATLFPVEDLWLRDSANAMWGSFLKKGTCITKRFVFNASAIAKLKSEAVESGVSRPTRVEVISAILWRSMASASAKLHGSRRPSLVNHLVNLRRRMEPSLVENVLGNFLWIAPAIHDGQTEPEFGDLVGKVREAIARVDCEFVEKMRGEEGKSVMEKCLVEVSEIWCEKGMDCFGFSSWCNFGYYDVANFGWGNPIWVSSIGLRGSFFLNLIILNDTKCGEGVEVWVTLDEQEMAILETNEDIVRFVSLDPSPLLV
ncbi:stemmadenine O-acetyltransferase-like [Euphorbia lathyris]|uniref:stemmadenine O-acetyltransferase-like n=1 Tax=Euphorbia lathyris TaxID=212925 RepID=UPI00331388DF